MLLSEIGALTHRSSVNRDIIGVYILLLVNTNCKWFAYILMRIEFSIHTQIINIRIMNIHFLIIRHYSESEGFPRQFQKIHFKLVDITNIGSARNLQ
jgi:hypothetical protein